MKDFRGIGFVLMIYRVAAAGVVSRSVACRIAFAKIAAEFNSHLPPRGHITAIM